MSEPTALVKDGRVPEIAFLLVIAVLLAMGGQVLLHMLDLHRLLGAAVLLIGFGGAVLAIRRAYVTGADSVRRDVTKAACYAAATLLAFVTIAFHLHWAIGATIVAYEAAIMFDIITIAARPRASGG